MRKYWLAAAALSALVFAAGCELLLGEKNLFEDLEPDLTAKYDENLAGDELLDALSEDTQSASFYEDLSDASAQTIAANLDAIIGDEAASDRDVQEAVTFKTLIALNTTELGEVVNSLASAAIDGSGEPEELLAAVFEPLEGMILDPDPADFEAFIDRLLDLKSDFDVLVSADPAALDAGAAQTALVAYALFEALDGIDTAQPGQADPVSALKNSLSILLNGDPGDDDAAELVFDADFDLTQRLVGADDTVDTALEELFVAAGLGNLGELIDGMNG